MFIWIKVNRICHCNWTGKCCFISESQSSLRSSVIYDRTKRRVEMWTKIGYFVMAKVTPVYWIGNNCGCENKSGFKSRIYCHILLRLGPYSALITISNSLNICMSYQVCIIFPKAALSYFNYYSTNVGREAFELPLFLW